MVLVLLVLLYSQSVLGAFLRNSANFIPYRPFPYAPIDGYVNPINFPAFPALPFHSGNVGGLVQAVPSIGSVKVKSDQIVVPTVRPFYLSQWGKNSLPTFGFNNPLQALPKSVVKPTSKLSFSPPGIPLNPKTARPFLGEVGGFVKLTTPSARTEESIPETYGSKPMALSKVYKTALPAKPYISATKLSPVEDKLAINRYVVTSVPKIPTLAPRVPESKTVFKEAATTETPGSNLGVVQEILTKRFQPYGGEVTVSKSSLGEDFQSSTVQLEQFPGINGSETPSFVWLKSSGVATTSQIIKTADHAKTSNLDLIRNRITNYEVHSLPKKSLPVSKASAVPIQSVSPKQSVSIYELRRVVVPQKSPLANAHTINELPATTSVPVYEPRSPAASKGFGEYILKSLPVFPVNKSPSKLSVSFLRPFKKSGYSEAFASATPGVIKSFEKKF